MKKLLSLLFTLAPLLLNAAVTVAPSSGGVRPTNSPFETAIIQIVSGVPIWTSPSGLTASATNAVQSINGLSSNAQFMVLLTTGSSSNNPGITPLNGAGGSTNFLHLPFVNGTINGLFASNDYTRFLQSQTGGQVLSNLLQTSIVQGATNASFFHQTSAGRSTNATFLGEFFATNGNVYFGVGFGGPVGTFTNFYTSAFRGTVYMIDSGLSMNLQNGVALRVDNGSSIALGVNGSVGVTPNWFNVGTNSFLVSGNGDAGEFWRYRFIGDLTPNYTNLVMRWREMSNYVALVASNAVRVTAGANVSVTPSGSGGVMSFAVASSGGGGGTPTGTIDGQIQYYSNALFQSSTKLLWDETSQALTVKSVNQDRAGFIATDPGSGETAYLAPLGVYSSNSLGTAMRLVAGGYSWATGVLLHTNGDLTPLNGAVVSALGQESIPWRGAWITSGTFYYPTNYATTTPSFGGVSLGLGRLYLGGVNDRYYVDAKTNVLLVWTNMLVDVDYQLLLNVTNNSVVTWSNSAALIWPDNIPETTFTNEALYIVRKHSITGRTNVWRVGQLPQSLGASVLVRSNATPGGYTHVYFSVDGQSLVRNGGVVAPGAVNLANANAVSGQLPKANLLSTVSYDDEVNTFTLEQIHQGPVNYAYSDISGTSIDWALSSRRSKTLTGNVTFTFANLADGREHFVRILQDATGTRTVTWPGSIVWVSSTNQADIPVVNTNANQYTYYKFIRDGGTIFGWVSSSDSIVLVDLANITGLTKGDVFVWDGTHIIRLAAGTTGQALLASSSAASGLAYVTVITNALKGWNANATASGGQLTVNVTNASTLVASNATTSQADFTLTEDYISTDVMRANLTIQLTNLVPGRSITYYLTGDTNVNDRTVTVVTNGIPSIACRIRWNIFSPTNGSTSFTVTNNTKTELSLKCVPGEGVNEIWAVWSPFRRQ